MLDAVFGIVWAILTFPFRLVAWVVDLLGRLTGLLIGFALSALLLVGNLLAAATKWRGATGVTIGAP